MVKTGRFSIPWSVDAVDGRGRDYGEVALGQIDGSIAASGTVVLRTWFSVHELPPELADGRKPSEATLAYVRALAPTMTFTAKGGARRAHLAFGKQCQYDIEDAVTIARKKGRSTSTSSTRSDKPRPKAGNGMECSSDYDCASNDCEDDRCTNGDSDDPELANDAACTEDSDCASGDCVEGICE